MTQSDFLRHSALVFSSTMLVNIAGFLYHVIVSRRIGVAGYGSLTALISALMVTVVPATILGTIVAKYAAEFRALDDTVHLRALVRGITTYISGAAFVITLGCLLLTRPIGAYLHIDDAISIDLTIAMLCLNLILPVARGVYQGVQDFNGYSISVAMEALLRVAIATVLVFAGYGLRGALIGWFAGSLIALVYTLVALESRYRNAPRGSLYFDVRRLLGTSYLVGSGTLIVVCLGNVDVILVKHFFDPQAAGLYGAVSFAGKMLLLAVNFVPTIVLPKATTRANAGQSPMPILLQGLALVAVLAGSGLVLFYFAPTFIVTLLAGKAFAAGGPLVFSYGLAMVLLGALNVVVTYKMGIHRFDFIVPLALCALGEIVAITLRHQTQGAVVQALIAGNALAFAASLYRIGATKKSALRNASVVETAA